MAILLRLESQAINPTWHRIETQVTEACERSHGRYLASDVKAFCERGDWQIWLALNEYGEIIAVAGTEIVPYPQLKAINIRFGIGHDRKAWQHFRDDIAAWGKSQGCILIESNARIGWRRIFTGWRHTHDFIEQEI